VLPLTGRTLAIATICSCAFLGTNFIAWKFHFPTSTERLLWRVCSCILLGSLVGLVGAEWAYSKDNVTKMQAQVAQRRKTHQENEKQRRRAGAKFSSWQSIRYRYDSLMLKICNNSPEGNPALDVSPVFAIGGSAAFAVYFCARMYVIVEDLIAFRAMPQSVYYTVDWWTLLPHLG
jgi:hypothetical protein